MPVLSSPPRLCEGSMEPPKSVPYTYRPHYVASRKVAVSIPDEVTEFFNWSNPSSRSMALESIMPLTEISTRNIPGGKMRPGRKADNLTAICEPLV
jgi:hypothetical protein